MLRLFLALTIFTFFSCRTNPEATIVKEVKVTKAAVASANAIASEIGVEIMKKGGNAIDAAIAVHFALAVVYPQAGNIGGGGFMVYRQKSDNSYYALDYREMAPEAATEDMYLDSLGNVIPKKSTHGFAAAGIPGSVDGMWQAYQRFSKLQNWEMLLEPAIKLAREGFIMTETQIKELSEKQEEIKTYSPTENPFTQNLVQGEPFVQEDLAKTLEAIRDKNRYGFYTGWVADAIVSSMEQNGGNITYLDLLRYKSKWRIPSVIYYRGFKAVTMPLPSSGGILLPQMMEMANKFKLRDMGLHSPDAIHLVTEVERRAYADRAMHMGDTDFVRVPIYNLMHSGYLDERVSTIKRTKATPSNAIRGGIFQDSPQTTHFSVVDEEGNAVSITTTLNARYGSKVVVPNAGFLLNNEMDDFSVKPGVPNLYGLVGGDANKIQPYKRMLSSMTPTIVERDEHPFLIVGSPGGSTIPTTVFQVISNMVDYGMDLKSAVNAPRFHHQWLPDILYMEEGGFDQATITELEERGHEIKFREKIGQVNAIHISVDGTITAVGDRRKDNSAAGY